MDYLTETRDGARLLLPDWKTFDAKAALEQLRMLVQEGRSLADALASIEQHTPETLIRPLEEFDERLHLLWGPITHMTSVAENEELRKIHDEGALLLALFATEIGQHEGLARAFHELKASAVGVALSPSEKKIVDDEILGFRLSGVGLPEGKKDRITGINEELTTLSNDFEHHLVAAQDAWSLHLPDASRLIGVPDATQAVLAARAKAAGKEGFLIALQQPIVIAILDHAEDRELRKSVFEAWAARASDRDSDPTRDNLPLIRRILALRHEKALLLGFTNFADEVFARRMAPSPVAALSFIRDLAVRTKPYAEREYAELCAFAKETLGIAELQPWDLGYASERLRIARYEVDSEALRDYFPASRVFSGFFDLLTRLYGVRVNERPDVLGWRKGVRFFEVYGSDGQICGGFYADLFASDGKRPGAWMDECVIRRHGEDGGLRLPVAYLIANFTPGANGGESYLTHDEVETLFHEGGHVFHHLLGRQDWAHHHMSNVEWDAVELPSQVMENWAWEKEILQGISAHRDDKRPIPDDLVAKIQKARLFQYAMTAMRQFELGLVDLRLHMEYEPARPVEPTDVLREVRKEVRIAPIYEHDRFLDSFAHIFAGSYAAGYYGYKWSEAIAADTFEAFIESGNVCDPTVGKKLLALLEAGSSRPFMELIRDFRGRDPDPEALMRRGGMG